MTQLMVPAFGYKSHINIDRCHGLIRAFDVSDAATNDGARFKVLLQKRKVASPGQSGLGRYGLAFKEE